MVSICQNHNLQENMVCMGELCHKRVGCELCIRKHDHKFYLDTRHKQQPLSKVQNQLDQKILHLKKYIRANIGSLKLQKYKQTLRQTFQDELIFIKNKIDEEKQNFYLWIQRIQKTVKQIFSNIETQVMANWQYTFEKSQQFLKGQQQYEDLRKYFEEGDWGQHRHVQKGIKFLYSEEALFKFNRNIDNLKKVIHFNMKDNKFVFTWIHGIRSRFPDFQLCPELTFQKLNEQYKNRPNIADCKLPATRQRRQDQQSVFNSIIEQKQTLLLYPKIIYEPFQHVYKLIRINNLVFATTGARSLNIWSKINLQPQKVYQFDYTTYALSTFIQKGQQESDLILLGKSNGQMGQVDTKHGNSKFMKAHEGAIRDIIQFDEYHFVTTSQDWLIKVWAMNDKQQNLFASERGVLKGHSGKLHCLSKFGPNLIAGGADGTVRLWDIESQSFDQVFEHEKEIYCLAEIRPQLFLSGGQLNELRLFDYRTPKSPALRYPVQHCCNSALRYNENSFIFADRNNVKLVDIRMIKQPELRYENKSTYEHAINSMDFLSDIQIGMGGSDCFVTIWKY